MQFIVKHGGFCVSGFFASSRAFRAIAHAIAGYEMSCIFNFQDIFFVNIIEFGRSSYSLIQNSCYFIHYFTRYGHFKFDIKRF